MRGPHALLLAALAVSSMRAWAQDPGSVPELPDPSRSLQALRESRSPAPAVVGRPVGRRDGDAGDALEPGSQSTLDSGQVQGILDEARVTGKDGLKDAARLHKWLAENFSSSAGGGVNVGRSTARTLLESRELTGCHDWGLMLSTLLRYAGYPARMVDTAGAEWMTKTRAGQPTDGFQGHVFVEADIGGSWVLLDSTSPRYLKDYDPKNPFIPMKVGGQTAYVAMFKGTDPAGYGLGSVQKLNDHMLRFAEGHDVSKLKAPGSQVLDLPSVGPVVPHLSEEMLAAPCQLDARRTGVVLQFERKGLDVHVEKSQGSYQAHLYPYRRVFSGEPKTMAFATLAELRSYLSGLSAE